LSTELWLQRSRWCSALDGACRCLSGPGDLNAIELWYRAWLECELGGWLSAGLVVSNEAQNDAETGPSEQTAVLGVRNLPYLAEDLWVKGGALEEGDGAFAGDDA
jgi:hypothetical protein